MRDDPQSWWHTTPLGEARRGFRDALKARHLTSRDLVFSFVQYFAVANVHGAVRNAALSFPGLMGMRVGKNGLLDELNHEYLVIFTLTGFRATLALAEFSAASLPMVIRASEGVFRVGERASVHSDDYAFLRVALSVRTGNAAAHEGDYLAARNIWADSKPEESPGIACKGGLATILVEWLLANGREEEAIAFAEEAAGADPCLALCGLAPQLTLAHILGPLIRLGREAKACEIMNRLTVAAPPHRAWLLPAGCRLAALATQGSFDEAFDLYQTTHRWANDPDVSEWHRLHYHGGAWTLFRCAIAAGKVSENDPSFTFHHSCVQNLANAFDVRNGNDSFAKRWTGTTPQR